MAKRTRFADYKDRYENYRFELSEEGILLMQCHTAGDSLVWDWKAHDEMSDAFADVAGDREIKVLIHTGTGANYNANWGPDRGEKPEYLAMDGQKGLEKLDEKAWYGRMLIENVLAVEVPTISAVNGPCNIHSEIPLLSDIVLASDDAYFQDLPHFPRGMVPGDGQHVIWPAIVGRNRARYLLLTGKKLSAQEALEAIVTDARRGAIDLAAHGRDVRTGRDRVAAGPRLRRWRRFLPAFPGRTDARTAFAGSFPRGWEHRSACNSTWGFHS